MRDIRTRHEDATTGATGTHHGEAGGTLRAHPQLSNRDLQRRLAQRRSDTQAVAQAAAQAATRSANARAFRESMKIFARSHIPGRVDKLRVIVHQAVTDTLTGRTYDVDKYGTAELELVLSKVSSAVLGTATDAIGGLIVRSLGRLSDLGAVVPTKVELGIDIATHEGVDAVRTGLRAKPDLGTQDPFSAALKLQDKAQRAIEGLPRSGRVDLPALMNRLFERAKVLADSHVEVVCAAIDANVDDDFAATTWEAMAQTVAMAAGGEQQPSEAFVRTWMMAQLLAVPADMVDTVDAAHQVMRTLLVHLRLGEQTSSVWGRSSLDTALEATGRADAAIDHAVVTSGESGALERDRNNRRMMSLGVTRPFGQPVRTP